MITTAHPYLVFRGEAAEAIELYRAALDARVVALMRWADLPGQEVPAELAQRVMHAELRFGGGALMMSDAPPQVPVQGGNQVQVLLDLPSAAEVDRVYAALVQGGEARMAPHDAFWGARYAELVDRFGIAWKLNHSTAAAPEQAAPFPLDPERDLLLDRTVDVSPEQIWACWTDAERLLPWFCPKPWRVSEAEIDPRPGGIFRTVMEGPAGERMDSTGCILEAVPGRRLVWTDAMGPGFRIAAGAFFTGFILLEPTAEGGTRYRAVARHADAETARNHAEMGFEAGWGAVLDQLVTYIKTGTV